MVEHLVEAERVLSSSLRDATKYMRLWRSSYAVACKAILDGCKSLWALQLKICVCGGMVDTAASKAAAHLGVQVRVLSDTPNHMGKWRNGRRACLRSKWAQARESSSLSFPTIWRHGETVHAGSLNLPSFGTDGSNPSDATTIRPVILKTGATGTACGAIPLMGNLERSHSGRVHLS